MKHVLSMNINFGYSLNSLVVTFDANFHVIGGNLTPEETLKRLT
jgi:hypothetical protein